MDVAGFLFVGLSVVAFVAALVLFFSRKESTTARAQQEAGISDVTKLIEAITKMVGALQKAGPAISLLAASLVFATMGTALLTTDAAKTQPPAETTPTKR